MDEMDIPLELYPPKIIAKKGQKKVRYQMSGEKRQISIIGCGSVMGYIIPPLLYLLLLFVDKE